MIRPEAATLNSGFSFAHLNIILCLAILLTSCRSAGKSPDTSVKGSQASYILTATALSEAYTANLSVADAKYKDKIIYLTGAVDFVESDLAGGYTLNLSASAQWYDIITCKFSKDQMDDLLKLTKGSYVRIKARCSGKSSVLTLTDCILVDEKGAPL